jgi:hypothetical protein
MQPEDWDRLIDGINRLHGTGAALPAYRNFVKVHVRAMTTAEGMTWRVRTMTDMGMIVVNLPAWHRQMLVRFEGRLQRVYPSVFIPTGTGSHTRIHRRGSATRHCWTAGRSSATPTPTSCPQKRT